jgi:DNA polymerase-1
MIDAYFETYPRLKEYMAEQIEKARKLGYVETILGRKRHLKDINSTNFVVKGHAERNAVNAPIQGSAADIIKLAMIKIDRNWKLKNWKPKCFCRFTMNYFSKHQLMKWKQQKHSLKKKWNLLFQLMFRYWWKLVWAIIGWKRIKIIIINN